VGFALRYITLLTSLDETLTRYYRPTRLEKYGVKPYI
jgi:hypothetical protein